MNLLILLQYITMLVDPEKRVLHLVRVFAWFMDPDVNWHLASACLVTQAADELAFFD